MKKIAVLGAGFVSKPAVDYFLDRCGYEVIVTSLHKQEAEKIIAGRPSGQATAWTIDQVQLLDKIVSEADLVMSMIPPALHLPVAQACLKYGKNMVTTSYISPEMEALDESCRNRDILILNEIGEDPGLDNMSTKLLLDQIKSEQGRVTSVTSYGAGLPAFEHNNNPFGYKFSWSPKGLISAAQSSAAYLDRGNRVEVAAGTLFNHHWLVDLERIGTFETYPNRDCTKYLGCFGLGSNISFFRGLLRYAGWCNTMKGLSDLKLFDTWHNFNFKGMRYADFTASLIDESQPCDLPTKTAGFLKVKKNSDLMNKLKWLGLFSDRKIKLTSGTKADVLIELMIRKLSYEPHEKDMVIVSSEVVAEFRDNIEKRVSTLLVKGDPEGDSAMSRAVSLPAAIASKLILENKIDLKGVRRPTDRTIYSPVLQEMEEFGYRFKTVSCALSA